ncbi:MAG: DUF4920 domain-containing protein [Deltaproteobacteria bacterium]|nr:MAG: DUF4920 domain-containing protein [Deltaproteobacteria bacterium]
MKLIAKMLGIVVIGGALSTTACGKKDAAPAEGAAAVAVENAPATAKVDEAKADEVKVDEAKADEVKIDEAKADEAPVATAQADEAPAAKADGEADCPFHEEKGEAAGGCGHEEVAKAEGGCEHAEGAEGCGHEKVAAAGGHEEMGCDHAAMAAADAPKAEGETHFGDAFTLTEAKPLASVIAANGDGSSDVVQVSGTIHQVCQAAGCWMVVKDGDAEARVVMKGHAFTVPKDAKGKPTVVEGTMKVRTFTEAQAKHLAQDAGKDPSTVTGETKEYVFTASAITIKG